MCIIDDMRRSVELALEQWRVRSGRKPLVVLGARQVGKTYALEKFGRRLNIIKSEGPIGIDEFQVFAQ